VQVVTQKKKDKRGTEIPVEIMIDVKGVQVLD
jgi:hypothetical protein